MKRLYTNKNSRLKVNQRCTTNTSCDEQQWRRGVVERRRDKRNKREEKKEGKKILVWVAEIENNPNPTFPRILTLRVRVVVNLFLEQFLCHL
jgi:hypothetical protein